MDKFIVSVAGASHMHLAEEVCELIADSAEKRGTGIALRSPEYVKAKMTDGKAVIALTKTGNLAGFCYIETWGHDRYVANSGLIVHPDYRNNGLAQAIKKRAFKLSREKYPNAKLFGLTTSMAVMKINSDLGYRPVAFSELTDDESFWKGCSSCVNYDILTRKNHQMCLCTGMLYDPEEKKRQWKNKSKKVQEKLMVWKQKVKIK
ncbi:GNAT family N-acetyltransferase [Marinoscillum furvescens]|uniref:Acetyltransferase (GNAT) family protein n=1 Tax=Marinoscillum furvescens DSM 4134 TaxID=1122208 RepID=A0A3D9KYZ9_MARFU|nr:GNAT family N-acetyltransferase [Marinoscillum furvescens]RED93196.1 acetyltransferase (GNAT) family protein [Marinoscillum furvescens DSM 4134]